MSDEPRELLPGEAEADAWVDTLERRADAMSDDIRPLRVHALNRTSPKGGPFVGTCSLCGKPNLTLADIYSECENPRGLTRDEALIETIVPPAPLEG